MMSGQRIETMDGWFCNLVASSSSSYKVTAATEDDWLGLESLVYRMGATFRDGDDLGEAEQIKAWFIEVLQSPYWLILVVLDIDGFARGLAVCEYGSYEVDHDCRYLKCRYLYVESGASKSLHSLSKLLLRAVVSAAARSPKVLDVLIVTSCSCRPVSIARCLQRYGFTRIGSQHVGFAKKWSIETTGLRRIKDLDHLSAKDLVELSKLANDFHVESNRADMSGKKLDFAEAMTALKKCSTALVIYLAYLGEEIVGFIVGRPYKLPLSNRQYLQSLYFYVKPAARGGRLALRLFDAFSSEARARGLSGALLGTSSNISTARVCKLLEVRGYEHIGDVLTLRVSN